MTLAIVIFISLFSIAAFRYQDLFARFELSPYQVTRKKEYHRIVTHAFLHADYVHLIVNMLVLWSFGREIERIFQLMEERDYVGSGHFHFILLVVLSIVLSSISTILKHKDDPGYHAVGASGAVSAVVFTYIFFRPLQKIYFYFAIPIPGIVFGILYLVYSTYMSRRKRDNINHDAHLWGAIFGFFYPLIMEPGLVRHFWNSLFPG